ncbi:hypothetical protein ACFQ9X_48265 [Catenulispora yoronensis]
MIALFTLAAVSGCGSHAASPESAGVLPSQTSGAGTATPSGPATSAASGTTGASSSAPATSGSSGTSARTGATPSKSAGVKASSKAPAASSSATSSSNSAGSLKPPSGSWPSAANTGVTPGAHLVSKKGEINVNTDGAVVENIDLVGDIRVEANNVTIRNVRITNPRGGDRADWGILQWVGYHGLTVQNVEIIGASDTEMRDGIMDPGGVVNVRNCNIHGISKHGIDTTQGVIADNYIHDPNWFTAADGELDSIRISGSPDAGTSLLIQHNTLVDVNTVNGAISMFETDGGQPTRVTIDGNYFATWGFSIYAGGASAPTSYIVVKNNVFARKYKDGYMPVTEFNTHATGNAWSANTFEDGKTASV